MQRFGTILKYQSIYMLSNKYCTQNIKTKKRIAISHSYPLLFTTFYVVLVVPVVGLEPTRGISPTDFESVTSTNSITPACLLDK